MTRDQFGRCISPGQRSYVKLVRRTLGSFGAIPIESGYLFCFRVSNHSRMADNDARLEEVSGYFYFSKAASKCLRPNTGSMPGPSEAEARGTGPDTALILDWLLDGHSVCECKRITENAVPRSPARPLTSGRPTGQKRIASRPLSVLLRWFTSRQLRSSSVLRTARSRPLFRKQAGIRQIR